MHKRLGPYAVGSLPVIGVVCDSKLEDGVRFQTARDRYCEAMLHAAGTVPLLVPTSCPADLVPTCLAPLHGLLLTGASSDIHPLHYGFSEQNADAIHDAGRDRLAFAVIGTALSLGLPILGICRGLQELNVYFGGTLVADLRNEASRMVRHDEDLALPRDDQYKPSHRVTVSPGSTLSKAVGEGSILINSLHHQGILVLGDGLKAVGVAEDGLIEAVEVREANGFALGVQWHPEWHFARDPVSSLIFGAFGRACSDYAARHPFTVQ